MVMNKFERLLRRRILTRNELEHYAQESSVLRVPFEELLEEKGVPKHEILFCLSEYYGVPFVEYEESVIASYFLTIHLDLSGKSGPRSSPIGPMTPGSWRTSRKLSKWTTSISVSRFPVTSSASLNTTST
jgi:hypothetical protein